jgi:hypothetical protein
VTTTAAQLVAERASQRRVQGGERLVEQEQRRLDGERAAQRHALALATGELAGIAPLEAAEAEALNDVGHPTGPLHARTVAQPESDVVGHREVREQRVALEHVADTALLRRHVDPGVSIEQDTPSEGDPTGVRPDQSGQALQRQRLAGSRGTEQHGHAVAGAPGHVEREAGQPLRQPYLQAGHRGAAHAARAPNRPAASRTMQDTSVSTMTRTSASPDSPVCTAV